MVAGGEQTGVLGVSLIPHRRDSRLGHAAILRALVRTPAATADSPLTPTRGARRESSRSPRTPDPLDRERARRPRDGRADRARRDRRCASRPPLRLALVLDRSGSMAGPKLAVAQRCAAWLAERLRPAGRASRSSASTTRCACTRRSHPSTARCARAIASLRPGGSTNLSGGWLKGLEQLRPAPADGVRKILLLTDGLANVGITDRRHALAARRDGRAASASARPRSGSAPTSTRSS